MTWIVASSQSTNLPSRQIRWWLSTAIRESFEGEMEFTDPARGCATHGSAWDRDASGTLQSSALPASVLWMPEAVSQLVLSRPPCKSSPARSHAFSQGFVGGENSSPIDQNSPAHRHQLGGTAGQREDRSGVRIANRCGPRDINPKRGEVRILANLQRSDTRFETESAGAADRCQLERLVRTECIMAPGSGSMNQYGEPRFVEHVHSIVAC